MGGGGWGVGGWGWGWGGLGPLTFQAPQTVHCLSPFNETRSLPLHWAVTTRPARRCTRRLLGGGDGAPLRACRFRLRGHLPAPGLAEGRGTASPAP